MDTKSTKPRAFETPEEISRRERKSEERWFWFCMIVQYAFVLEFTYTLVHPISKFCPGHP